MSKDDLYENDGNIVLVDEDDNEHEFAVIDIFDLEGKQYAVLQPVEGDGNEDAIILRLEQDEVGNDLLADIEDDLEWEAAAQYWEDNFSEEDDSLDDELSEEDDSSPEE